MSSVDEFMAQLPMGDLARKLGMSEADTEAAVRQAAPALFAGMAANAQDPAGASSLARALDQHDGSLLDRGVDVDQIDTDDGQKIVRNIFGSNEQEVVNKIGGQGSSGGAIAKLLPLLAPLVLAFLSRSRAKGSGAGADAGGLGDLLGGLLDGGGLGSLLGGAAGSGGSGGGGLGDLLGGLLGGGKR